MSYISGLRNLRNHRKQYGLTMLSQGELVIAVVGRLTNYDPKSEFDPFLLERTRNCLNLLRTKQFIQTLQQEV